jgi:hypothetical protein
MIPFKQKCFYEYKQMLKVHKIKHMCYICKNITSNLNEGLCASCHDYNYGHPHTAYDYYLQKCLENNICWQCGKNVDKLHKRMCQKCYDDYINECEKDLDEDEKEDSPHYHREYDRNGRMIHEGEY